jgi:hypothetical protein
VIIFLVRDYEYFGLKDQGNDEDPNNNDLSLLSLLSKNYCKMGQDVIHLRHLDSLQVKDPRLGYMDQEQILMERVDIATSALIFY